MSAIVVLVKQVPDYESDTSLRDDYTLERDAVDKILDEPNEHAVEAALLLNDTLEERAEIIALTMGPEAASEAVRRALAMGADRGIHICDEAIAGSDATQTAWVLAHAVSRIEDVMLLVCGDQSSDGGMGSVPATIADYLGIPAATSVDDLEFTTQDDQRILCAHRTTDGLRYTIDAQLPAVVSVTEQANEPRFPSFKGIMAAKKKEVDVWTLSDIGVDTAHVGVANAGTAIHSTQERPEREQGEVYPDNGDGAQRILDYLTTNGFLAQ